jgi:hypothetical protein
MNAARMTIRAWTLDLRAALGALSEASLHWCLLCGRVGLRGWRPVTPSMPITWVCTDRPSCQQRRAAVAARVRRGGAGSWWETAGASPWGIGLAWHPRLGSARAGLSVPGPPGRPASATPPLPSRFQGGSR